MDEHVRHGVTIDDCPACGGVWLGKGGLDHLFAAVSPVRTLAEPEPVRGLRGAAKPEPVEKRSEHRFDDRSEERARESRAWSGRAGGNGRKHSRRSHLKAVREDIFDVD